MKCALRALAMTIVLVPFLVASPSWAANRSRAQIAAVNAISQIGTPYRWGGTSPRNGFDCSGLMQWAYRKAGKKIPRVTYSQYAALKKVRRENLRRGDLVFFYGRGHVGMWLGNGRFIHSPKTGDVVKVSRMKGWYSLSYAGAVRP